MPVMVRLKPDVFPTLFGIATWLGLLGPGYHLPVAAVTSIATLFRVHILITSIPSFSILFGC